MADIKPFLSVRPREDVADKVAALPYDVYNRVEATKVVRANPLSFLSIDRAETSLPDTVDTYDPKVYAHAKELYDERLKDNTFIRDEEQAYYIYELIMDGRSQVGIVAVASIDDYINGIIKKHENTREDKEIDRITHVDTLSAQTGPIFLAYRSDEVINTTVNKVREGKPLYDFTSDDNITHRVYKIAAIEDVSTIRRAFDNIASIYIADGHHRCASAVKVGLKRRNEGKDTSESDYFLSVLFPSDQLRILDYNRAVKDLNGLSTEEFLDKVIKSFTLEPMSHQVSPVKKGEFGMYVDKQWYRLTIKPELTKGRDVVKSLDVSILQDYLLEPILGIHDPRTDARIDFIGGIRGLKELKRRADTDMKVAFSMYPTSIDELFDVADAGLLMPPKSTWFEPKLRSGLFIHEI